MAGLTAAKVLLHAGRSFVVLEAQNRIGGRAWADANFETPIDLGGAWIHAVESNPLAPIVIGSGRKTQPTNTNAADHIYFNGRFANERERALFSCIQEKLEENLGNAAHPNIGDRNPDEAAAMADYGPASKHMPDEKACAEKVKLLKKGDASFAQMRDLVSQNAGPLEAGVTLANNSTLDAADFAAGNDSLIDGGFGGFVAAYGREVETNVKLSTKVVGIQHGGALTAVTTEAGATLYAKKTLVTVSTGVLAKGIIKFDPPLDDQKTAAIKNLPMGLLNKAILQFDPKTMKYPTDRNTSLDDRWVLYGGNLKDPTDDMAFVFRPMHTNIIIAFVGAERAEELEKAPVKDGHTEFEALALKALGEMCQCDAKAARVKATTTSWGTSSISFGAYSAARPADKDYRITLAAPIHDRVYFAGEACYNTTYNGSFAAAYSSALKTAIEMIGGLCATEKPENLTQERGCALVRAK